MEWLTELANAEGSTAFTIRLYQVIRWVRRKMLSRKVEFFNGRPDLDRKYPIERTLKYGNEVYLWWMSGQGVLTGDEEFLANNCIKKIILPNPDSDYVNLLWKTFGGTDQFNFPQQIKNTTRMAQRLRIPVRWARAYIGSNLIIVNPDRTNGAVLIEPCLPYIQPNGRRSFRFENPANNEEVISYFRSFQRAWDEMCDEPPNLDG